MKKIPTLFVRDFANNAQITPVHHPDVQWVVRGEGVATRKYDGSSALICMGEFYKRYMQRPGKDAPAGFIPIDYDPDTGKTVGWVPVNDSKGDRWFREAWDRLTDRADGTFELLGPKVQSNPEGYEVHVLLRHSLAEKYEDVPTDFHGLGEWLRGRDIEGLVWHHPDGRMAKIKLGDYGIKRNAN